MRARYSRLFSDAKGAASAPPPFHTPRVRMEGKPTYSGARSRGLGYQNSERPEIRRVLAGEPSVLHLLRAGTSHDDQSVGVLRTRAVPPVLDRRQI